MDFSLTEEQVAFQDSVRRFAEQNLAKDALARAHDERFPWDVAKLMAENGLEFNCANIRAEPAYYVSAVAAAFLRDNTLTGAWVTTDYT